MRKGPKRIALGRETLVRLDRSEQQKVAGGNTEWSQCFCTDYTLCHTDPCGTKYCW